MTLNLMVCPHDTANNPDRWYMFVQYLAQKLDDHINFEISLDFADFHDHMNNADILYANPTDSVTLIDTKGFAALVRPSNKFDEVVFVANEEVASPTLQSLDGAQIASVKSLLPTKIALHILDEAGIKPAEILDNDSWTSVISSIWRGEATYGIIYKDTYDELSEQGKGMVNVFSTSDEKIAFHNVVVGNNGLAKKADIEGALLAMHSDDKGKEVLTALGIDQWLATTPDDIAKIQHIIASY